MSGIVNVNGEYKDADQPVLAVSDRGFLYGDGIFESISVWNGVVFRLEDHIVRLFESLHAAGLAQTGWTHEQWCEIVVETIARSGLRESNVRVFVTRGVASVPADPRKYETTRIIWPMPYYYLADDAARKGGVRLMLSHLRGFSPESLDPRYKSLNRLHFQLARIEALAGGFHEALWLTPHGYVAETWASNIFIAKDGVLHTPGEGILPGITRRTIIELASRAGIETRERNITAYELFTADEIFTASTAGGPLPVREVSGRFPLQDVPGPMTKTITDLYWQTRENGEWGTVVDYDAKTLAHAQR